MRIEQRCTGTEARPCDWPYGARKGDRPRKSRFLVGRNPLGWQTQILGGAL